MNSANRNTLWAAVLTDELARNGIRHVAIAPGSRSAPLVLAFAADERFRIYPVIDERGAAFFALGIGKASGQPAVVVTTSGTATANLFPAIIEANYSNTPVLVLTADRPHDLRDSGANQTIDQVKLYGDHVRWFVDVSPPEANSSDRTLRYLRTTVCRAVAYATGWAGGPVHLNIPFRKPLEPLEVAGDVPESAMDGMGFNGRSNAGFNRPFTEIPPRISHVADSMELEIIREAIVKSPRGLIICGQDSYLQWKDVKKLSEITGYPVLAEALSNLRFQPQQDGFVSGGYETYLHGEFSSIVKSDLVLQFGRLPVGSGLLKYMDRHAEGNRFVINGFEWSDASHSSSGFYQVAPSTLIPRLNEIIASRNSSEHPMPDLTWMELFRQAEKITWSTQDEFVDNEMVEGALLSSIVSALPVRAQLFVASSNPVRHLNQFVRPQEKIVSILANRGASGIDGTVASALGVAVKTDKPTILVIGDLALYHDLNSLHLIRRLDIPLIIVVINNDGGGIFQRLPIATHDPPFTRLFQMPHGLTFEHAAAMFDIPYTLSQIGDGFRNTFKAALDSGGPHLIEVPSDAAIFEQQRQEINRRVAEKLEPLIEDYQSQQNRRVHQQ